MVMSRLLNEECYRYLTYASIISNGQYLKDAEIPFTAARQTATVFIRLGLASKTYA